MFLQVIQVLLGITILVVTAERTPNTETSNSNSNIIKELIEQDVNRISEDTKGNSNLVRRSVLHEKSSINEDTYYKTFYNYGSEATTLPTDQNYRETKPEIELPSKLTSTESPDRIFTEDDRIILSTRRKPKKYPKYLDHFSTGQNGFSKTDDKRLSNFKQPKSNSHDKSYDYEEILYEMQNLREFGSKIFPKQLTDTTKEATSSAKKKKKTTMLIEKTNNLITGVDVLNINEAILTDENSNVENSGNIDKSYVQSVENQTQPNTTNELFYIPDQTFTDTNIVDNRETSEIKDKDASESNIIENSTPLYFSTKEPDRKVTNLSQNPIVVPDLETVDAGQRRLVQTLSILRSGKPEFYGGNFAIAEALKGNFTNKLSGFRDTKPKVVVDIQKSVPIYLGSITKYLFNNSKNTKSEPIGNNSSRAQSKSKSELRPSHYDIFPIQPVLEEKKNFNESHLPVENVTFQFEIITPSPLPPSPLPPSNDYTIEGNLTNEYILLPLDQSVNSQIAPLDNPLNEQELPPQLNILPVPQTPENQTFEENIDKSKHQSNEIGNHPAYMTYSLQESVPVSPEHHQIIPGVHQVNEHILFQQIPRAPPTEHRNIPPYIVPYPLPFPINQNHYLDPLVNFQPPPVNIPALTNPYFPALPGHVKGEEPKVLPVLPFEIFQLHLPLFPQNKGFQRGRHEQFKVNLPSYRKNRIKPLFHPVPIYQTGTSQVPPNHVNQGGHRHKSNYNNKSNRPADLESSNSAKIEHYSNNLRSNRNARYNFDNVKMEYGFMPPLIPSLQIDEYGRPIEDPNT